MKVAVFVMFALMTQCCGGNPIRADPTPACTSAPRLYVMGQGRTGLVVKCSDPVALVPSLAADLPASEQLEIGRDDEKFYRAEHGALSEVPALPRQLLSIRLSG